jgi:urease subunit gamma/beta
MPLPASAVTDSLHSPAVQLNPTEADRLRIFTAAQLARVTLERGIALNAPEAVALVCDEMHLAARAGGSWDDVVRAGRSAAARTSILPGVAEIASEIRLEVLLEEGTRLVVLREPFGPAQPEGPGAVRFGAGDVPLVPGRERRVLTVTNDGERPIRVSSHFPFWQTNRLLSFDRAAAEGFRLDLPAGDSVRWAPGEAKDVPLVAFGGSG